MWLCNICEWWEFVTLYSYRALKFFFSQKSFSSSSTIIDDCSHQHKNLNPSQMNSTIIQFRIIISFFLRYFGIVILDAILKYSIFNLNIVAKCVVLLSNSNRILVSINTLYYMYLYSFSLGYFYLIWQLTHFSVKQICMGLVCVQALTI